MYKDGYKLYDAIVKECNNDTELAYIKAKKKIAEHYSLKKPTQEQQREEHFIWCKVRDILADILAMEYMEEKGYERKITEEGIYYYEGKEQEHGTNQK